MTLNLITTRNNSHFRSCYFCCGSFRLHLFSRDHFWSDIHFHTYCFVAQQLFRSLVSRWCHYLYVKKKTRMVFGHMFKHKKRKENKDFLIKTRPAARGTSVLSMALHINYFSAHRLHMDKNWQFFFQWSLKWKGTTCLRWVTIYIV